MDQSQPSAALTGAESRWRVMRLTLILILDLIEISRGGDGDVLDPLILGLVITASVAPISQDARLEQTYATVEATPPDALRRPVSISAVARSLRLPFETTRRRIAHLVETGQLTMTRRGVFQSEAAGTDPAYVAKSVARYERLKRFYFDLLTAGALPPSADRPAAAGMPDGPPVRVVNRVLADFILRALDRLTPPHGDRVRTLIMLQIARLSGEHIDPMDFEGSRPLGEADRRPVTAAALSRTLNIPPETVRRNVKRLERDGVLRRTDSGFFLADSSLQQEQAQDAVRESAANLGRLFARLTQFGVLDWWDAEAADHAGRPLCQANGATL